MFCIKNAKIYTPDQTIEDGLVLVEAGRIVDVGSAAEGQIPDGVTVIDGRGRHLVPGFIDLQLNGGFGHDFTADPQTIWPVAERLPPFGVTGFLPTVITSPLENMGEAMAVWQARPGSFQGAIPLGLHLEGPFLNPDKKGAHNPAYLRPPDQAALGEWCPENGVRLVTLAPELPGALELIRLLTDRGVVISAGHSMATYEQATAGFAAGIRYGTHLFNAMPPLHHREPGLAGALLNDPNLIVGLIPDGEHVHPLLVKTVWQLLGGRRLNLVTDAMAAMGMPSGVYQLGDFEVTVDGQTARLADGTLAGSIITLDQALRNLIDFSGCTLAEALPTVTSTPADLLGMPHKGRIAPGCDADLVLLNEWLEVEETFVGGKRFFSGDQTPLL